jgi:DNA polymerase-3 subunit delta'
MKGKKNKPAEQALLLPRENRYFLGHEEVVADFYAAYDKGNIPGGWLISGKKGIGKATLAYRLARFILYHGIKQAGGGLFASELRAPDLFIPENSATFNKVASGGHPDLLILEAGAQEFNSASGEILVEEARKISNFLHMTSSEASYRIVLIDSIDNMNANAANSILKLLEEPPTNSIFILISHSPGKLLPTIRSRCRNIKMQTPDANVAYSIFNKIVPDASSQNAAKLLEMAYGSPGVAYNLHINNGLEIYEEISAIVSQLPRLDLMAIQKLGENISGKSNDVAWDIFRAMLNKSIIDTTKHRAIDYKNHNYKNINMEGRMLISNNIESLVHVWQEINAIIEDATKVHLERKAVLLRIFSLLKERLI